MKEGKLALGASGVLWLWAHGALAVTSVGGERAPLVQVKFTGANLKQHGLPAGLADLFVTFDASQERDRFLMAPITTAWEATQGQGEPGALGESARQIISGQVDEALRRIGIQAATAKDLEKSREELNNMRLLTTLYEMSTDDAKVKMAQAYVVKKLLADAVANAIKRAALEKQRDGGDVQYRGSAPDVGAVPSAPEVRLSGVSRHSTSVPDEIERRGIDDAEFGPPIKPLIKDTPKLSIWRRVLAFLVDAYKDPVIDKQEDSPAMVAFRRFEAADFYGKTAEATRMEIVRLRALPSGKAVKTYLRLEGEKILEVIKRRTGKSALGFHYNMHGGQPDAYVRNGIRSTMGDRVTNRNQNPWSFDTRQKIFFYQTPGENLYDILDSKRMDAWPLSLRMGDVISIFDMEHPAIIDGLAAGKIEDHTMSTWNRSWAFLDGSGIPYSAFVLPPLDVFNGVAKKIGFKGRISRDEETLAVMRYFEAVALSDAQ